MPSENPQLLDRFHKALVVEIQRSRPEYLEGPFTVAEIYQNLVPYRTHRDVIGVEMNGDYEDALLRLLGGQGDYLVLESEHARRQIRSELESPNPNTGLFREFAAVDVRLNPARIGTELRMSRGPAGTPASSPHGSGARTAPSAAVRPDPPPERPVPAPRSRAEDLPDFDFDLGVAGRGTSTAPVESTAPRSEPPSGGEPSGSRQGEGSGSAAGDSRSPKAEGGGGSSGPAQRAPKRGTGPAEETGEEDGKACLWCQETLPRREHLNYCPFCGANAHLVPCPNCGEELEPTWRFCVACGTQVGGLE